ncbi:MAG: response regulator transcription factor [Burkholderiales bacterium]|nr:response regulator transcription factor [Burkholderiales bacterium]
MACGKLLICDDHPPIRKAVTYIARELISDIEVVEAGNGAEALALLEQHPDIDLVLLDLHMPGMSGFDLLTEIKLRTPTLPVVVLSSDETRTAVVDALERGATGYICKSSPTDLLAKYLEHALGGHITLPITVAHAESAQATAKEQAAPAAPREPVDLGLSHRQTQVLGCLLRGMSNKQICRELGLAEGTIKNHAIAVFRALNVTSRAQAVIEASRRGLSVGDWRAQSDAQQEEIPN